MLAWLHPLALAGLIAAAGPVAVHLLQRRRADRVPFASLRFIRVATTSAVRMRVPSDMWLMALRTAIVGGAAVALAQPLVVTPGRRAYWNDRLARAIVVDTSASVAPAARERGEAAAAESRGGFYTVRIDVEDLGDGLDQAVDALAAAPPSRREIVVISDLQHGSLTSADIARVPKGTGLRFVAVDVPSPPTEFRGLSLLGATDVRPRVQIVQPRLDGTAVRLVPTDVPSAGLRILNSGAAGDVLLRVVARSGVPAPSADQPMTLTFEADSSNGARASNPSLPDARSRAGRGGPREQRAWRGPQRGSRAGVPWRGAGVPAIQPWMLRTILTMRRDGLLADAAREHRRRGTAPESWIVIARDASDAPVVTATAADNELTLHVAGSPGDYLAAATLRSALTARAGELSWGEHEPARISAQKLSEWTRPPVDVERGDSRNAAPGDGRWVWVFVLILLGIETVMRRRRGDPEVEGYADAA